MDAGDDQSARARRLDPVTPGFAFEHQPDAQSLRSGLQPPVLDIGPTGRPFDQAGAHPLQPPGLGPFVVGLETGEGVPGHQRPVPGRARGEAFSANDLDKFLSRAIGQAGGGRRLSRGRDAQVAGQAVALDPDDLGRRIFSPRRIGDASAGKAAQGPFRHGRRRCERPGAGELFQGHRAAGGVMRAS